MYEISIKMLDGRTRVIRPTESFRPFLSPKRGRRSVNNAKALVLDTAREMSGKQARVKLATITNMRTGRETKII